MCEPVFVLYLSAVLQGTLYDLCGPCEKGCSNRHTRNTLHKGTHPLTIQIDCITELSIKYYPFEACTLI